MATKSTMIPKHNCRIVKGTSAPRKDAPGHAKALLVIIKKRQTKQAPSQKKLPKPTSEPTTPVQPLAQQQG
jgi:hypothetical protein